MPSLWSSTSPLDLARAHLTDSVHLTPFSFTTSYPIQLRLSCSLAGPLLFAVFLLVDLPASPSPVSRIGFKSSNGVKG